jgi:hypothetical protein
VCVCVCVCVTVRVCVCVCVCVVCEWFCCVFYLSTGEVYLLRGVCGSVHSLKELMKQSIHYACLLNKYAMYVLGGPTSCV